MSFFFTMIPSYITDTRSLLWFHLISKSSVIVGLERIFQRTNSTTWFDLAYPHIVLHCALDCHPHIAASTRNVGAESVIFVPFFFGFQCIGYASKHLKMLLNFPSWLRCAPAFTTSINFTARQVKMPKSRTFHHFSVRSRGLAKWDCGGF